MDDQIVKYLLILIFILLFIFILLVFNHNSENTSLESLDGLQYLRVYDFKPKIRLGNNLGDGGYVIGNIKNNIYDCYISAGVAKDSPFVSNEESFSRDFILKYKTKDNYAFDGSINHYPTEYTQDIKFNKKYISNFNNDHNTDLHDLIENYNNIFLKMDIEGGEYTWLSNLNSKQLDKFGQIVIEFHFINNNFRTSLDEKIDCFEKLTKTHYLIHMHDNNFASYTKNIPDVIELTYINKKFFKQTPLLNTIPFPTNLDIPNNPNGVVKTFDFYPFCLKNDNNKLIPKKIYICHKTKEIVEKNSAPKWRMLNPDYDIICFGDKECRNFLLEEYGKLHLEIFDYIKDPPIKADFWRLCIIYKYGGIYVDADINPLVPFSEFLEKDTEFLTCKSGSRFLNPHVIMSIPKHYILKECIDMYLDFYKNKVKYGYWEWSIVKFMEIIMRKHINIFPRDNVYKIDKIQFLQEVWPSSLTITNIYCKYKNKKVLLNRHKNYDPIKHIYK